MTNLPGLNKKIPFYFLVLFLAYYVYRFTVQIWSNIEFENGYTLGDWLINYEDGGFKRRGLSGSFFIFLHDFFHLGIKKSVFIFQFLLNVIFVIYFYLVLRNRSLSFFYLMLLLSPCAFLFFFTELGSIGRKEIIIYAAYAFYLYRLTIANSSIWRVFYPFLIIVPLGILFHELFFFYLSFFLVPLFTTDKDRFDFKDILKVVMVFAALSISLMAGLYFFGGEINQGASFSILESRGISSQMRSLGNLGILTWNDNFDKFQYFVYNQYYKYLISLVLGFSTFFSFTFVQKLSFRKTKFSIIFFLTFVASIPVYLLAIDWGRWLNIHFVMLVLFFGYALKDNTKLSWPELKYVYSYILISVLAILFWRFELVDRGFYLTNYTMGLFK